MKAIFWVLQIMQSPHILLGTERSIWKEKWDTINTLSLKVVYPTGGGGGGYSLFGGKYQLLNYSPHILAMDSS